MDLSLYQILAPTIYGKIIHHTKTINFKYLRQHKMVNLNYLMDQIHIQIFKFISRFSPKNIK